jgi:hypothetical protein
MNRNNKKVTTFTTQVCITWQPHSGISRKLYIYADRLKVKLHYPTNFCILSFRFFPARQVLEIIFNEYSRNTDNALFEWLGKRPQGVLRNQSTRGFFGFEYSFENCF